MDAPHLSFPLPPTQPGNFSLSGFFMPITIPPFDQYQAPIVPLRGLWNSKPPEGDKCALCEVDWLTTTRGRAVQFLFSANSPVALSQIVAVAVDNRGSGYDVDFVFPDSGFRLTIPAYNQGIYPVFTNALMFYLVAAVGVVVGNSTNFMVFNSMPPPVALFPTAMQTQDQVTSIDLGVLGSTQVIPVGTNGTLNGFIITLNFSTTGTVGMQLIDGQGTILWSDSTTGVAGGSQTVSISNLHIRFVNGVSFVINNTTFTSHAASGNVNLFFTSP